MEYRIKDICNSLNFGVSRFYNLKKVLDDTIPEQNKGEYFYNNGRNFYITEKGFNWFKENSKTFIKNSNNNAVKDIVFYKDELIEMYKQRIEYLENENKRLLDLLTFKEQKEMAKNLKTIGDNNNNNNFLFRFFDKLKK